MPNEGIWEWNLKTMEVFFSPTYYTMVGYIPYEFPQQFDEWKSRIHPDDVELVENTIVSHVRTNADSFMVEFRFRTKQDYYIWIRGKGLVIERDEKNNPYRVVGTHTDIDMEKEALFKLKESEETYRSIVEQISEWIWEIDLNGNFTYCSPQCHKLIGYQPEELMGRNLFDLCLNRKQNVAEFYKQFALKNHHFPNWSLLISIKMDFPYTLKPMVFRYWIRMGI
ncbi:MAG: PAS domain-containing protein [Bacteroidales bacterium]|nr:PAS domain-containing protein [Bacteroidales bacterium]